jgi:uncharacterized protein (DUF1697 family)
MQTYVALLRAINLGSRNKISMADLRKLFETLGSEDVQTYVQSGNVVFRNRIRSASEVERSIEERINRDLRLDVTVLVRTAAQLVKVVAGNPFAKGGTDPKTLHVTFLADSADRSRVRDLDPQRAGPDEFRVQTREIFLHCPNGYGRSRLTNAYFEKRLGVAATTRNWRTVTKLAELANG